MNIFEKLALRIAFKKFFEARKREIVGTYHDE